MDAVPEGEVVLRDPRDVEGVGIRAVPVGMPVGGAVRGEDRLSLGDGPSVGQGDVGQGEAHRQVFHGRLVAQGLLDDVVPAAAAGADVAELFGVGEQAGHRLVDDVDRRLVPGTDHQEQRVGQFGVGQRGAVALVVAGGDEERGHVVAGRGALGGDEPAEHFVGPNRVRGGLFGGQGRVEDPVHHGTELTALLVGEAHEAADDRDGQRVGEPFAQVCHRTGREGGELVQEAGDDGLDRAAEQGDTARAERGGHHPPEPAVVGPVRGEHVVHGHPEGERPRLNGLFELRPVRVGVLGHVRARQQLLEEGRVGDGPGRHAEDVDAGRGPLGAQQPVLGVPVGACGVEDERGGGAIHA